MSAASAHPVRPRLGRSSWAWVGILVVGLGLVIAPFAFGMFHRGPAGAEMLDDFAPFMTQERIDGFQSSMAEIDRAVQEGRGPVRAYLDPPATESATDFDARFPTFASFTDTWPRIDADMTDLLDRVEANEGNYEAIAALPPFTAFPWFFAVPGAVLVLVAASALTMPGRVAGPGRWAIVALGVGLVVAPLAFGMFERAPKGGEMMDDFATLMTRQRVTTIQGYFGTMAVGEGGIRLGLVPALRSRGLDDAALAARFPAIAHLERDWVPIINDMTPMIGAMSDNVDNYEQLRQLPPFPLFPWFFVAPGALLAGLGLLASRSRAAAEPPTVRAPAPSPT